MSRVFSVVAFCLALVGVFFCASGWIENTWAASFPGRHQSTYLHRAEVFFFLLCASLLVALILALKWIRLGMKALARRTKVLFS